MPATETPTRKYELFLVFLPTLAEKELKKELEGVAHLISSHGEVFHEQVWGTRDLYYKMRGQTKGIYVVLCFHFDPSQLQAFRSELVLRPNVLRHNLALLPDNDVVPVRTKEPVEATEETAVEMLIARSVVMRKPKVIPVESVPTALPSETTVQEEASVQPSPTGTVEPSSSVESGEIKEASSESGISKKGKHKNLDEGLDKILSDLSSL